MTHPTYIKIYDEAIKQCSIMHICWLLVTLYIYLMRMAIHIYLIMIFEVFESVA